MSTKFTVVALLLAIMLVEVVVPAMADNDKKDPTEAGAFSFFIPGAGQGYVGDWARAGEIFGGEVVLSAIQSSSDDSTVRSLAGVAMVGGWVWNIFDAVDLANKHNAKLGRRAQLLPATGPDGRGMGLAWNEPF
jgi:hypothetical protein